MKDDDQQDEEDRSQLLEYPAGHEQAEIFSDHVEEPEKTESDHDLERLRILEPAVELVDKKSHNEYVGNVLGTKIWEQLLTP